MKAIEKVVLQTKQNVCTKNKLCFNGFARNL